MESKKKNNKIIVLQTPWLRPDGSFISHSELKELSKQWNENTWEEYLSCVVDVKRSESSICQASVESQNNLNSENEVPHIVPTQILFSLKNSMNLLSVQQRKVIHFIFWEQRTFREIAEITGLSLSTVRDHKNKALRNLRKILKQGGTHLPYVEELKNKNKEEKENESDI